jgi:lipid-binding SYLF domain-containing protein
MMFKYICIIAGLLVVALGVGQWMTPNQASAASAAEIDREVNAAIKSLGKGAGKTKALVQDAKAVLVFPSIVKGGFMVGGQYGEGALRKEGKTVGYYSTVAASYGLQIGVQKFGYALFFMNDSALSYVNKSDGWEIGVGPSIVVLDEGMAKSMTTTTTKADIFAVFFSQKGLMAGAGLQGTKITKIKK